MISINNNTVLGSEEIIEIKERMFNDILDLNFFLNSLNKEHSKENIEVVSIQVVNEISRTHDQDTWHPITGDTVRIEKVYCLLLLYRIAPIVVKKSIFSRLLKRK